MSISDVLEGDLVDIVAGVGYFLALAYIMLAISHLCEEYFVASLSVVVEVFNIPPEVAGATLMAAGTSSPELFAAIIGLFFSKTSDTGISTVVGSVVFNTLMILGCSIWVSPTRSIQLTAGSFGRECVFFFASLMMLYISYGDGVVKFWEGCLMVMIYMLYVFWCWSGEKIIAYTRYAIFCQKEKGAGEHAGPPFHKLSESGTGTIATEQDSHHNILRVHSEEGISNLAVQSVPGKELELVDFAGRPETSEEEEEKDEEKAGEGASTLAVLKAEARVLLAVFYQTCVLREYFLRLPPDSANHPAALEHALAWARAGAPADPAQQPAPLPPPPPPLDAAAAPALAWLLAYAPGAPPAAADAGRRLAAARRAVRGRAAPRAALAGALRAKLRAVRVADEAARLGGRLLLAGGCAAPEDGEGGAPGAVGAEELLAALGLTAEEADEEAGGEGPGAAGGAVPMARVGDLVEGAGGPLAQGGGEAAAGDGLRLGRLAQALEEVLAAGKRAAGWEERGFLRGREEQEEALAGATEASVLVPSDAEVIRLAARVAALPEEGSAGAAGGGEGGGLGSGRDRLPFAHVVALSFLWSRYRSKFFLLSPLQQGSGGAGAEGPTLQERLAAYEDKPHTERMFSVEDMVTEDVIPEHRDPFTMPSGGWAEVFFWFVSIPYLLLYKVTIPDCKKPRLKKYYMATLLLSTLWLSVLTFCLIRTAESIGDFWHLSPALLGFTLLAAGTSFPDFFSSIVVARYGDGDMAVSNALGSNTFDILFGLGLPVVLKTLLYGEPEVVSTRFLTLSIGVLAALLGLLVAVVLASGLRLTLPVGYLFVGLYLVYIVYCVTEFLK